ncbi:PQQ-binding-like beta-propeller repeat protein [Natronolimnobius sp. AArcel1]|uniref:outer membrane protein assembly factor BamB family protein n=1 Tax=Natronolimnobius sp. AArcel1 TaxID=1679093 RepID=UPI0013EB3E58|nr:PQQ-binding-like beta-propeller repeat protein [Natronolimnobius sp. AArcel1]NGM68697.1 PQQ-binding-like beta-propeller repeat protein [Natronolimnobius sp. AArcel1]
MTRVGRRVLLSAGAAGVVGTVAGCSDRLTPGLKTFDGSVSVDPSLAADTSSWMVTHGDPANTRSVPADAVPEDPSLEWADAYDTHVGHTQPVGHEGAVVGSNQVDSLFLIDADRGEREWTVDDEIASGEFEPRSNPIITDEAVLIASRSALWAFDRDTGDERWQLENAFSISSLGPNPTAGDEFVFGRTTLGLAAHSLETGEREWEYQIGLQPTAVAALEGETVYVGGGDATLYALERDTGEERWHAKADGPIGGGPVVTDSRIYVGTDAGSVSAIDQDGDERWQTGVTDGQVETLAVGNGIVCAETSDDAITVLDPETGDRVWRSSRVLSMYSGGPVIGDGLIITTVGSSTTGTSNRIAAFDGESGSLEWESDRGGLSYGPAVIDGALYATGRHDGRSALAKFS